jgi:hypothetical protein
MSGMRKLAQQVVMATALLLAFGGQSYGEDDLFVKRPKLKVIDGVELATACIDGRKQPDDSVFSPNRYSDMLESDLYEFMPFGEELRGVSHPRFDIGTEKLEDGALRLMLDFPTLSYGRCMHVVTFPPAGDNGYLMQPGGAAETFPNKSYPSEAKAYGRMIDQCANPAKKNRDQFCRAFFLDDPEWENISPKPKQKWDKKREPLLAAKARVAVLLISGGGQRYRMSLVGEKLFIHREH